MNDAHGMVPALVTGGVGATIGGIITAVIQVLSHRGESRATAADLVTKAAGTMVERLDRENRSMRKAILLLTEVLDEMIDDLDMPDTQKEKLRKANAAAKLSASPVA